jgi:hypothetical protein
MEFNILSADSGLQASMPKKKQSFPFGVNPGRKIPLQPGLSLHL